MQYAKHNFSIYQGALETPLIRLCHVSVDNPLDSKAIREATDKTYVSFSGSDFIMSIKVDKGNSLLDQLTTANGRIVLGTIDEDSGEFIASTDNSGDTIKLVFPSEITKEYTYPSLVYDIFRLTSDNSELLLYGNIQVIKSITYGK